MQSKNALNLILDAEGCDLTPCWPGADSGVTYGRGFDLGYNTSKEIVDAWKPYVSEAVLAYMQSVAGVKGEAAKRLVKKEFKISQLAADSVFENVTLPRFEKLAMNTYPGLENLHPDAIGAIVSLVFNRGASLKGDSRVEMANLKPLIASGDITGMAAEIRKMKRLWEGKNLGGLITRRENEALLIEG